MTGAFLTDAHQVVSPAPQLTRVSVLCRKTQVDVSLPLDVPIASVLPHLVKLSGADESAHTDTSDDPSTSQAKNTIWVLSRHDGKTPLMPEITLREASVAEGELLRLTAERALSAPTLYDDVVDAAARLNKARYPGWDGTAARWMAFAGVYLVSGVWVYFLAARPFAAKHAALAVPSVAVALALAATAALAYRRHAQRDTGAALGWAVLPIAAAVAWLALHGFGGYGLAGACGALAVVAAALFRFVGTGRCGYLAVQVISGFVGLALVAHTAGLRASFVGAALALTATLGCLAVPRLTVLFARVKPLLRDYDRSGASATNVSHPSPPPGSKGSDTVTQPAAETVWARVESGTLTRSALYTGLAVSGALGAVVVLTSSARVHWSGLAFALGCAAAFGFHTQQPATAVERAGLAIPAVALTVVSCVLAQNGSQPIPIASFGALLAIAVVFAVIGAAGRPGRQLKRLKISLAYLTYLITAALIPLALWAIGGYWPWSST